MNLKVILPQKLLFYFVTRMAPTKYYLPNLKVQSVKNEYYHNVKDILAFLLKWVYGEFVVLF